MYISGRAMEFLFLGPFVQLSVCVCIRLCVNERMLKIPKIPLQINRRNGPIKVKQKTSNNSLREKTEIEV